MEIAKLRLADGTEDGQARTPWESFALAYAAMVPIVAGAAACLLLHGAGQALALHATIMWSGAVLCFLSGVRRGLSFRQQDGPLLSQLAGMLWLFALGVLSLLSPWPAVSLALQMLGYATSAVLDPRAAAAGEAPRYFGRLRPVQMLVPLLCLGAMLIYRLI